MDGRHRRHLKRDLCLQPGGDDSSSWAKSSGRAIKHAYHRLTTVLTARNGVTEFTYIAEALIPLIAFGLPLSPVAAGPAAPLFNAPPRFSVDTATGQVNNLHNMLNYWEFLGYGMLAVLLAALVSYPFAMNYAHRAAAFVSRKLSHEAIIGTFIGIVLVIGVWEGQDCSGSSSS